MAKIIAKTLIFFAFCLPLAAWAQTGTFNLATGAATGTGYTYAVPVLTVNDGADVEITGTTTSIRIEIAAGATASVTLNGVSITGINDFQSPLLLNNGANLTITLIGENVLTAGLHSAGIQSSSGTTLTIGGDGSLAATGGQDAAGIGGGYSGSGGAITINGGTITATGGSSWGAGIGGGGTGSGGIITINGGTVTAKASGNQGADIGGGGGGTGSGGIITINGGTVVANSKGIGGSDFGLDGAIAINGGMVTAVHIGRTSGGTLTMNGNAVVFGGIMKANIDGVANGILFGTTSSTLLYSLFGTVYGTVTLAENMDIPSLYSLTIPNGSSLTIPNGKTLTINEYAVVIPDNGSAINVLGTVAGSKITGANVSSLTEIGNAATLLAATGQTVEYAYSTSNSAPASGWQASADFSNLAPSTDYYFFARSAENANFAAGTASSTLITTDGTPSSSSAALPSSSSAILLSSSSLLLYACQLPTGCIQTTIPDCVSAGGSVLVVCQEPPSSSSGESTPARLPQTVAANSIAAMQNALSLHTQNNARLQIYNLSGKNIKTLHFANGVYNVPMENLPKGVYIVKAAFSSESKILRVVVK